MMCLYLLATLDVSICEARHDRFGQRRIDADRAVTREDLDLGQLHRVDRLHLGQTLDAGHEFLEQLLDALRRAGDKIRILDLARLQPFVCYNFLLPRQHKHND